MQKQKIVIWGTGRFAELAYYYYKDECNILFFTDSNSNRWNSVFCNLPVKNPDMLTELDVRVILAFQSGKDAVRSILNRKYGITDVVEFEVEERKISTIIENKDIDESSIVITFSGGLGNQLFQFALLYHFYSRGIKTFIDVSYYNNSGVMDFSLLDAFEIPKISVIDAYGIKDFIAKLMNSNESMNFTIYKEPTIFEQATKKADKFLLNLSAGFLKGTFQSYYYIEHNKDSLLKALKYKPVPEKVVSKITQLENDYNIVSVHVRRGDYLTERNRRIYGNICTPKYYQRAIEFIESHVDNVLFLFFSDDILYVKEQYKGDNFIYFDSDEIDGYQDWYDMYLMSRCKHNIIANSTFSWWGAMLNQNPKKIVIAPDKWVNDCKYLDIYPMEWITMEG